MASHIALRFGSPKWLLATAIIAGTACVAAVGMPQTQTQPQSPARIEFDVASIKPIAPPYPRGGGPWTVNHGRFRAQTAQVRAVIGFAYDLMPVQVHGGPDWLDRELYAFDAESGSSDAGPVQLRAMLQTLLMDRFKLAVHRETQEQQVGVLVVGKSGLKMQEAKEERRNYINWTGPGQVEFTEINLLGLVNVLSGTLGIPVLDNTGLKGFYNFKLQFADPRFQRPQSVGQLPVDTRPDIFTAVQEQLGLELKTQKGPREILVIDHIERPSEN
jgi:uncharacterized protein (TIGR03435 family)